MRLKRRQRAAVGVPPGYLVRRPTAEEATISRYRYDAGRAVSDSPPEIGRALEDPWGVTWINVDGMPDAAALELLAQRLGIHPLVLEDMQSPGQRPKVEDYGRYLFIVFTMLSWDDERRQIHEEQVALLLFESLVITVQQYAGDVLDPVRRRIATGGGRIRRMGADYLAFALLDVVIDNYLPVLEQVEEEIVGAEEAVLADEEGDAQRIYTLRRELINLRRLVWPLRNVLGSLRTAESDLLGEEVRPFLAELNDNGLGMLETFEVLRDHIAAVMELRASQLSASLNVVMKTLTVIASIFIPLTFIAGIYGMNFGYMPELAWRFGYPAVLGVMLLVAGVMIVVFRRRKWL